MSDFNEADAAWAASAVTAYMGHSDEYALYLAEHAERQQSPLAEAIAGMQEAARIMDDPRYSDEARSIATEQFARLNAIAEAEEERFRLFLIAVTPDPEECAAILERMQ